MDKKTRTIIIIGCIVTFVIVPAVTIFLLSKNNATKQQPKDMSKVDNSSKTKLPDRSNDELLKIIADTKSDELTDNGKPIFGIKSVSQPAAGWYVVTIHLLDDPQGTNPAKMLVQDTGSLAVLLGPGTSFPSETTESIGVPDVVAKELNK
jgi:hypothetical protein